jgi:hypothetical protein
MEGWKGGRVEGWKSGRLEAGQGKGRSLVQVIYQAVHWSFYRSAIWLLTDDLYLGVVGGILLVAGEWMLAPRWAERVGQRLAWEELLMDASVLIATSVIFFFVPNLWLLLPVHWLLAMISRRIGYSAYPANHTA